MSIKLSYGFMCTITVNGKQECFDDVNIWCDWCDRVNCGDRPMCDDNDMNGSKSKRF